MDKAMGERLWAMRWRERVKVYLQQEHVIRDKLRKEGYGGYCGECLVPVGEDEVICPHCKGGRICWFQGQDERSVAI